MSDDLTIYLADFSYDTPAGLSKDSLPLGIGTIASYLTSKLGGDIRLDVRLFITYQDLMCAFETKVPDILGTANFEWSENLTAAVTEVIAEAHPEVLQVTGGANISPHSLKYDAIVSNYQRKPNKPVLESELFCREQDESLYEKFSHIDVFVHGEGEVPMYNLCQAYLASGKNKKVLMRSGVPGCSINNGSELVWGSYVNDIKNLDDIPSPYLMGFYDEIWQKHSLIPQVETNRGCPYRCTFCTVGSWSSKIRSHSIDYIMEEISYLGRHSPNKVLRFADSNFGILTQDMEISDRVMQLRAETGFPAGIRLYTAEGGVTERIKHIMKNFRDLIPLNVSFQSASDHVLHNIKRKNRPNEEISDFRALSIENQMMLSTELILGLPGESLASFSQGLENLIREGFESFMINPLILIRGSDLDTKEQIEKWDYKVKYGLIGNNVEEIDGKIVFEYSKLPVSSNSYTEDEYFEMLSLSFFAFLAMRGGWLRPLLLFSFQSGVSLQELFIAIRGQKAFAPILNEILVEMIGKMRGCYYDSLEALTDAVEHRLRSTDLQNYEDVFNYRTQIYLLTNSVLQPEKFGSVFDEISRIIGDLMSEVPNNFEDMIISIRRYCEAGVIVPLHDDLQVRTIETDFDVHGWMQQSGEEVAPLSEFERPMNYLAKVRNVPQHELFKDNNHAKTENRKVVNYFETVTGANMKRTFELAH